MHALPAPRSHDPTTGAAGVRSPQRGQGMVEYAVLLALIAVVAIAGLVVLGPSVATLFLKVVAFLSPAPAGVPVSS